MKNHIILRKLGRATLLAAFASSQVSAQTLNTAEWSWARHYGGQEKQLTRSVKVDDWGNVYGFLETSNQPVIMGNDTLPAGPYWSDGGFALVKHNRNGQLLFSKRIVLGTLSVIGTYPLFAGDMAVDANQNIYVTGIFTGPTLKISGNDSISVSGSLSNASKQFIVKYSSTGAVVWKKYGVVPPLSTSQFNPPMTHIAVDKDGDAYLLSRFSGYGGTSYGFDAFSLQATSQSGDNFYIAKFSGQTGQTQWLKNGFTGSTTSVDGLSIDANKNLYLAMRGNGLDMNGTVYTVPNLTSSAGRILLKLNASGNFAWVKGMTPGPTFKDITSDKAGNVYISGNFYDTLRMSSPDEMVVNTHYNTPGSNTYATFVLCFNPAGVLRWNRVFYNQETFDDPSAIAVDDNQNCYVTMGNYGRILTGNDTIIVNPVHFSMLNVLKLDSTGALHGYKNAGYNIYAAARSFTTTVDGAGNVYTGGEFYTDAANLSTALIIGNDSFHAIDAQDAFIAKLAVTPAVSFDTLSTIAWCAGDSVIVPFHYNTASFASGIMFTLDLSSAGGYFNTPLTLATTSANITGTDTFKAMLPTSIPAGTNYQLRIKATLPSITTLPYWQQLTIAALPPVPVITLNNNELTCSLSGYSYQWYKDNILISGATNQIYIPTVSGSYSVQVTNAAGCSNMSAGFIYNTTGVQEMVLGEDIAIYPNPVATYLTIDIKNKEGQGSYIISDIQGRKLHKGTLMPGENKIVVQQLPGGIYLLQLQQGVRSLNYKMIKRN